MEEKGSESQGVSREGELKEAASGAACRWTRTGYEASEFRGESALGDEALSIQGPLVESAVVL